MDKSKEILMLFKENEERAFRELFNSFYDNLLLYAIQFLNDSETAKDVVQDCFVDFYVNKRFNFIRIGLEQYLFQAVKHRAIDHIRSQQRREHRHQIVMTEICENVSSTANEQNELEAIYVAINQLPEARRKIFTMIYLDGMKYQEVADKLSISINPVKKQMGRAFKTLRETLQGLSFTAILMIYFKRIFQK